MIDGYELMLAQVSKDHATRLEAAEGDSQRLGTAHARRQASGGGMTARLIIADVFDGLRSLPDASVDLVLTSPPFLALRSYLPADHGQSNGHESDRDIGSVHAPTCSTSWRVRPACSPRTGACASS